MRAGRGKTLTVCSAAAGLTMCHRPATTSWLPAAPEQDMGRASQGKKGDKARKFGKSKGDSSGKRGGDKTAGPSSKRQRAGDEDQPTPARRAAKLDELTDVSSFFDAVEEGVDLTEPSHSTFVPGQDDDDGDDDEDESDEDAGDDDGEEDAEDDSDDDSDDESAEEEEEGGDASDMRVQIAKHKQQLAKLQEQDPEFYEYMKQEGTDLMDFGADVDTEDLEKDLGSDDDDDEGDDDDDDDDDDEDKSTEAGEDDDEFAADAEADQSPEAQLRKAQGDKKPLAMETLVRWEDAAKQGKPAAVSALLKAFDAAAVLLTDNESGPVRKGAKRPKKQNQKKNMGAVKRFKFKIESGDVFDALLVCMTREMPGILMDEMLDRPTSAVDGGEDDGRPPSAKWKPQRSNQWKHLARPVGTYCRNMLTLLKAVTETDMMSWVLRAVSTALPLISAVPKLPRELLKITLTLWATGEEAVRARSFIVIHRLCKAEPKKLLPLTLKGMYLTYVRHTKTSNPSALPRVNFFVACITDIFGMDMELSYQHAFVSIRQLAVTLRTALSGKTRESTNAVCCWPFVNAVRCWGQVLGRYPAEAELGLLIYPYTQLVLGSVKVASTPALYPMRFLLLRFLTHVSSMPRVNNYIPLAPYLLEVLDNPAFRGGKGSGNKKKADIKPPPIEHVLKVSKQVVQSRLYQQQVVTTACELLVQTFGPLAYSISFPELSLPATTRLKRFSKETAVGNFRKAATMAASHLSRNATWVENLREECGYELLKPTKLGGVALREMEMVVARKAGSGADKLAPLAVFLKQRDAIAQKAAAPADSAKSVTFEGDETPGESKKAKKKKKGVAAENAYQRKEDDDDDEDDSEDESDDEPEVDPEVMQLAAAVAAEGAKKKKKPKKQKKTKSLPVDVMDMEDEVADVDMEDL
jgi:nucleolar complex protein 2